MRATVHKAAVTCKAHHGDNRWKPSTCINHQLSHFTLIYPSINISSISYSPWRSQPRRHGWAQVSPPPSLHRPSTTKVKSPLYWLIYSSYLMPTTLPIVATHLPYAASHRRHCSNAGHGYYHWQTRRQIEVSIIS